jgi:hypothetical protein
MAKKESNPIKFFTDNYVKRAKILKDGGDVYNPNHSVARVVNNYNDIPKEEKSIGESYMATTPSPNFKKGGSKKK